MNGQTEPNQFFSPDRDYQSDRKNHELKLNQVNKPSKIKTEQTQTEKNLENNNSQLMIKLVIFWTITLTNITSYYWVI